MLDRSYYATAANTVSIRPEGTDLEVFRRNFGVYEALVGFAGNAKKPTFHHSSRNPSHVEAALATEIAQRKAYLAAKAVRLQEKKAVRDAFVHGLKVGTILTSSWGYDQTNVDFHEVVEVKGKVVVTRKIASEIAANRVSQNLVVPVPGSFIGEPARRVPAPSYDGSVRVKIHDSSTAHVWDGSPQTATASGYGH